MRIRFLLLSFLMTVSIFAQDFSGRATYRTHRKSSIKLDSTTMASSPGIQEQLEAQMRKMFQKTYTLDFTKSKSVYKEVQELDAPKAPSTNGVMIMMVIVGAMRDGTVRMAEGLIGLSPREHIAMNSLAILFRELKVRGPQGVLTGVEALLLQDPVPVGHSHQPQGVLRVMEGLARARLIHLWVQSFPQGQTQSFLVKDGYRSEG